MWHEIHNINPDRFEIGIHTHTNTHITTDYGNLYESKFPGNKSTSNEGKGTVYSMLFQ